MCVRHVILLILPTHHVVRGPKDVNGGGPLIREGTARRRQTVNITCLTPTLLHALRDLRGML